MKVAPRACLVSLAIAAPWVQAQQQTSGHAERPKQEIAPERPASLGKPLGVYEFPQGDACLFRPSATHQAETLLTNAISALNYLKGLNCEKINAPANTLLNSLNSFSTLMQGGLSLGAATCTNYKEVYDSDLQSALDRNARSLPQTGDFTACAGRPDFVACARSITNDNKTRMETACSSAAYAKASSTFIQQAPVLTQNLLSVADECSEQERRQAIVGAGLQAALATAAFVSALNPAAGVAAVGVVGAAQVLNVLFDRITSPSKRQNKVLRMLRAETEYPELACLYMQTEDIVLSCKAPKADPSHPPQPIERNPLAQFFFGAPGKAAAQDLKPLAEDIKRSSINEIAERQSTDKLLAFFEQSITDPYAAKKQETTMSRYLQAAAKDFTKANEKPQDFGIDLREVDRRIEYGQLGETLSQLMTLVNSLASEQQSLDDLIKKREEFKKVLEKGFAGDHDLLWVIRQHYGLKMNDPNLTSFMLLETQERAQQAEREAYENIMRAIAGESIDSTAPIVALAHTGLIYNFKPRFNEQLKKQRKRLAYNLKSLQGQRKQSPQPLSVEEKTIFFDRSYAPLMKSCFLLPGTFAFSDGGMSKGYASYFLASLKSDERKNYLKSCAQFACLAKPEAQLPLTRYTGDAQAFGKSVCSLKAGYEEAIKEAKKRFMASRDGTICPPQAAVAPEPASTPASAVGDAVKGGKG